MARSAEVRAQGSREGEVKSTHWDDTEPLPIGKYNGPQFVTYRPKSRALIESINTSSLMILYPQSALPMHP